MKNRDFWKELATVEMDPKTFEDLKTGRWSSSLCRDENIRPDIEDQGQRVVHLDDALYWSEGAFTAFAGVLAGKSKVTRKIIDVYTRCSEVT